MNAEENKLSENFWKVDWGDKKKVVKFINADGSEFLNYSIGGFDAKISKTIRLKGMKKVVYWSNLTCSFEKF